MIRISCLPRAWCRRCDLRIRQASRSAVAVPVERSDRQGRERGREGNGAGGWDGCGADSIDDLNVMRHGGIGSLFDRTYALDAGIVPARVPVRARPPTRRPRVPSGSGPRLSGAEQRVIPERVEQRRLLHLPRAQIGDRRRGQDSPRLRDHRACPRRPLKIAAIMCSRLTDSPPRS